MLYYLNSNNFTLAAMLSINCRRTRVEVGQLEEHKSNNLGER